MLIHLVMTVLAPVFVFYLLSCWFIEKKYRVGGFFASWVAAVILAPMLADGRSVQAAMDKATLAGLSAVAIVVLSIAVVESLIYPGSVSENRSTSDNSKNSGTFPTSPQRSPEIQGARVPEKARSKPEGRESSEEEVWEAAAHELNSNQRRMGLWAKVFAESDGDENRAKALYLKIRYSEIKTENSLLRRDT